MLRSVIAVAALVACSGAWSEIIYLDCKTSNRELIDQGGYDRMYVIDTVQKTSSVHYDYGFFSGDGKVEVSAGAFSLFIWNSEVRPSARMNIKISRVTGKYSTEFNGLADSGECQRVDNPKLKF